MEQLAELNPELVYNPNQKNEPKTKNIFKVIKPAKSSRRSSLSISNSSEQNYLNEIQRHADQMNLFSSGIDFNMQSQVEESHTTAFSLPGFSPTFVSP